MPDEPTPQERTSAIKEGIRQQFNAAVDRGDVSGGVAIPDPRVPEVPPAIPEVQPATEAPTAPEPETPAEEGEPQPLQELIDPESGMYLGKYKTPAEMSRGLGEFYKYASQLKTENENLKRQATQVPYGTTPQVDNGAATTVPGGSPGARERVNPATSTNIDWLANDAVVKASENLAVDPTVLARFAEAVHARAADEVDARVQATLAPLQTQAAADAQIKMQYPEFENHKQEMLAFAQTNQIVGQGVQAQFDAGLPYQAMETLWLKYRENLQLQTQETMRGNQVVTEEQRQATRAAAGSPATATGTPVHAAAKDDEFPSREEYEALSSRARAGDHEAKRQYNRLFMKQIMSPEDRKKFANLADG